MIMKILLKIKEVVRGQNFLLGQLAGGWRKNKKIVVTTTSFSPLIVTHPFSV
jgi:hypothetical protein